MLLKYTSSLLLALLLSINVLPQMGLIAAKGKKQRLYHKGVIKNVLEKWQKWQAVNWWHLHLLPQLYFCLLQTCKKKRCKLFFFKFQRRILHHTVVSHRNFCAYEGQRQLVGGVIREQGLNLSSVSFAVWPCGSCLIYWSFCCPPWRVIMIITKH